LDNRVLDEERLKLGNFMGPTILETNDLNNDIYKEELFGPVLTIIKADTFEKALEIINSNSYGNGASIFTSSGHYARAF
jgi:malonate-semialdehyde dehydrogenase (acetylating)/methylmalonate-semialdehyde dehydrogenase